jgi:hypothetical protein
MKTSHKTEKTRRYIKKGKCMKNKKEDIRIVVLQRGWVLVGRYSEEMDRGYLDGASVIRKWGTEHGLGQLVSGPVKEGCNGPTILDKCNGRVEFLLGTTILMLYCEADKWVDICNK